MRDDYHLNHLSIIYVTERFKFYQPRLQGALSLKRRGPLKGDLQKTRVVKVTLVGPETQNQIFERDRNVVRCVEGLV